MVVLQVSNPKAAARVRERITIEDIISKTISSLYSN
jgi:hypothetical protein